ncbi:hypothetical protein D3C80_1860220 [compost metagenome]
MKIWPDAEQFIGADCTLKAVFMTGDTQMVAVEHIENGVCCCFWASMVRTPEQVEAKERSAAADEIRQAVMSGPYTKHGISHDAALAIYDAGYRKQVKP